MAFECPDCGSDSFKKNGFTRHGKQNYRCLDCGRQFSQKENYVVDVEHNQGESFRFDPDFEVYRS